MTRRVLFLTFTLILIASGAPPAHAESTADGLVDYWTYDSSSISGTTLYDTVGSLSGTLTNNPVSAPGVFHEALHFGTTTSSYPYVAFGNVNPISASTAFTFSVWINRDPEDHDGQFLTKWNDTGTQHSFIFSSNTISDNNIFFAIHGANGSYLYGNTTGGAATKGVWHLITASWSTAAATTLNVYVDGVLQSFSYTSHSSVNSIAVTTGNMDMGMRDNGAAGLGQPYTGYLDDFRIYNRVLSTAEITRLYNTNTARVIRLIGHIRLRGVRLR